MIGPDQTVAELHAADRAFFASLPRTPYVPRKRRKGEPLLREITTKEQFAARLNGRDIVGRLFLEGLTLEEAKRLKDIDLAVIYGDPELIAVFYDYGIGACDAEGSDIRETPRGHRFYFDSTGILPASWPGKVFRSATLEYYSQSEFRDRLPGAIEMFVREAEGFDGVIETDAPHAQFEFLCDGEKLYRGIVFSWSEAHAAAQQKKA